MLTSTSCLLASCIADMENPFGLCHGLISGGWGAVGLLQQRLCSGFCSYENPKAAVKHGKDECTHCKAFLCLQKDVFCCLPLW